MFGKHIQSMILCIKNGTQNYQQNVWLLDFPDLVHILKKSELTMNQLQT